MAKAGLARARNALAIVETAYCLEGTEAEWLGRVLDAAAADLDHGCGTYAFTCSVRDAVFQMGPTYVERNMDDELRARVAQLNSSAPPAVIDLIVRSAVQSGSFMYQIERAGLEILRSHASGIFSPRGVLDAFTVFAQDGEGCAVDLAGLARRLVVVHPRVAGIWNRVGVHLGAGLRLRRRFAEARAVCDAILAPSGAIEHAEGQLRANRSVRQELTRAVRTVERARTARERKHPERALEVWQGLVGGEWSLVDHWESAGRRYVAAYRNRPTVPDPRGLTARERVVFRYVALGQSNKEIAFTLGLSIGSIASAVTQIMRKLRCRRRSELLAFSDLAMASRTRIPVDGEEMDVLSVSHAAEENVTERLSPAERDIAEQIVRGRTNRAIAESRGTSSHTVANQIHRIFDKLEVKSRTELVRALIRGE